MSQQDTNAQGAQADYKNLFQLGGMAARVVAGLTLAEVIIFAFYPPPVAVSDWFRLFQGSKLIGIVDFWGLEVLMYLMFVPVFLALYLALRKTGQGLMLVALVLVLLGIAIFLATNNPFSMLSLSDQYATASSDAQRTALLAAGQALLANTGQRAVQGFNLGLLLVSFAGLMFSAGMLRGGVFGRSTAYLGIAAYALSLADYLRQALTSSALVALVVILPGALLLVIWFVLIGRRLYRLGRSGGGA